MYSLYTHVLCSTQVNFIKSVVLSATGVCVAAEIFYSEFHRFSAVKSEHSDLCSSERSIWSGTSDEDEGEGVRAHRLLSWGGGGFVLT